MIASGPLRAPWCQRQTSQTSRWLAVLSLTLLLALFTFFTAESHPLVHPWAWVRFRPLALNSDELGLPAIPVGGVGSQEMALTLGMSSILIQSGLLMALLLLLIRRWGAQLPLGWMTFVFSLNAVGLSIFHATPWAIGRAREHTAGWIHFLGNATVLVLALVSLWLRWSDPVAAVLPWGLSLSTLVGVILIVTGWLGGEGDDSASPDGH